jgi:hypothetical protein
MIHNSTSNSPYKPWLESDTTQTLKEPCLTIYSISSPLKTRPLREPLIEQAALLVV